MNFASGTNAHKENQNLPTTGMVSNTPSPSTNFKSQCFHCTALCLVKEIEKKTPFFLFLWLKWLIANEPVTPQVILYSCNLVNTSIGMDSLAPN